MKKKLLPLFLLLLTVFISRVDASNLVWAKSLDVKYGTFGSGGAGMSKKSKDNKVLALQSSFTVDTFDVDLGPGFDNMADSASNREFGLVKYDTDGSLLWNVFGAPRVITR